MVGFWTKLLPRLVLIFAAPFITILGPLSREENAKQSRFESYIVSFVISNFFNFGYTLLSYPYSFSNVLIEMDGKEFIWFILRVIIICSILIFIRTKLVYAEYTDSTFSIVRGLIYLFLGCLMYQTAIFVYKNFAKLDPDQLIFHLIVNTDGVFKNMYIESWTNSCVIISIQITSIFLISTVFLLKVDFELPINTKLFHFSIRFVHFSFIFFLFSIVKAMSISNLKSYFLPIKGSFIEEHYVEPFSAGLVWPQKRKNIILIILESMESSFTSKENGGVFDEDMIPEMTNMAQDSNHVHFSHNSQLGGTLETTGATWSIAGCFAALSGIPTKLLITQKQMEHKQDYIPGVTSLPNILLERGYKNYLVLGHGIDFGGMNHCFKQHGNFSQYDNNHLKRIGFIPNDYHRNWGVEDKVLYNFSKTHLPLVANQSDPFLWIIITMDTHFPDGYKCDLCRNETKNNLNNARRCASRQLFDFVQWFKAQPFYENTSLITLGDHLVMGDSLKGLVQPNQNRTTYNLIVNAQEKPFRSQNRTISQFDWFPTILSSIGVNIPGERLGLGTNLFSSKNTLSEIYSHKRLNLELLKKSDFYDEYFLTERNDPLMKIRGFWHQNTTNY